MVWAAALVLSAGVLDMSLVCDGGTVASVATGSSTATVIGSYGSAVATATEAKPAYIPFSVRIRIKDGKGTVQFPDGEEKAIRNLSITDQAIRGKVRVALLASSSLFIDRGDGSIATTNGFRGKCRVDDGVKERAF